MILRDVSLIWVALSEPAACLLFEVLAFHGYGEKSLAPSSISTGQNSARLKENLRCI